MDTIDQHLKQAFGHIREALDLSIQAILRDANAKGPVGQQWELFLGSFFQMIREKGKESKLNLLSLVKFNGMGK